VNERDALGKYPGQCRRADAQGLLPTTGVLASRWFLGGSKQVRPNWRSGIPDECVP
jgi:hypothetical protein